MRTPERVLFVITCVAVTVLWIGVTLWMGTVYVEARVELR